MLDLNKSIKNRKRLFVDMDGTMAQWRNISITVPDSESASPTAFLEALDEILYIPGYYADLAPHIQVVDAIDQIVKTGEFEVFIMSCYKPDKETSHGLVSPKNDKNIWLDKYIPSIDAAHRIFVPDGKDKSSYVPGGICKNDFLLDDYTHNLELWSVNGTGIKMLNQLNSSKGTWTGSSVSYLAPSYEIAEDISTIMRAGTQINHPQPKKNRNAITDTEFKELHKIFSVCNNVAVIQINNSFQENEKNISQFVNDHNIQSWNTLKIHGSEDGKYMVFFDNLNDLEAEIYDTMTHGKVQKIIPDEIIDSLIEFQSFAQNNIEKDDIDYEDLRDEI